MPKEVLDMPKRGFSFQNPDSIFDDRFIKEMLEGELMKQGIVRANVNFNTMSTQMKFHLLNLEFWMQNHYLKN